MRKAEIKKQITALKKIKERLDSVYLDAEETYSNRSDKWQESEAGEAYAENYDNFLNSLENLESAIGELENYI